MSKIGFIGLGIMGCPMAGHLLAGGHDLFVLSSSAKAADLISAGARGCADAAALAQAADIIITMVPDTPDVEAVLFGPHG
ncbi:MAG TPA: NAD(P)-binding domain-containing protein, partial [Acetobacteraceae bacterium]|nr:NAD(P)-binding domain-containing protein [Acetobacteraceae bacterium]